MLHQIKCHIIQSVYNFKMALTLMRSHGCYCESQMYNRDRRPTLPRVMASFKPWVSNFEDLWVFANHAHKINIKPICAQSSHVMRHLICVLSSRSDSIRCNDIWTWPATVILITGKRLRPPIWVPHRNKDGAGSGISGVHLWYALYICTLQNCICM